MASREHVDELQEYDFGGDLGDNSVSILGENMSFGDLDDDEDDLFAFKKINLNSEETAAAVATGVVLSLRESLKNSEEEKSRYRMQLEDAKSEIQRWRSSFQHVGLMHQDTVTDPELVVSYLQTLRSSEASLREQLQKANKKEAAFILTFAKREKEIGDLTSAIRDLRAQLKPSSMQARRLMLDPTIHVEFTRLKKLVEEKDMQVQELQDSIDAMRFNKESILGKKLIAKCKKLQNENDELGNQDNEGKMHELSMKLALQRSQNAQLTNHCQGLSKKIEKLTCVVDRSNELVVILHAELREKDDEIQRLKKHKQQQPDSSSDKQNAVIDDDGLKLPCY